MFLVKSIFVSLRRGSASRALLALLLTAGSQSARAEDPAAATPKTKVKIVTSLPQTGSSNAQATSIINGATLAVEEGRSALPHLDIELVNLDDASPERGAWDPVREKQNAETAIKDSAVVAYIGPYNSGAAKISMPLLNRAGVPIVNGFSTWPGFTKPGLGEPNEPRIYRPSGKISFFRLIPSDDIQGKVAARWATKLGAKRVFIVHDMELYGKGISEIFRKTALALGLEVLGFEGLDKRSPNYRSLAIKIKQTAPDLIFFGGTTQSNAGQLVKDIRAAGLTAKLLAPDGCFEQAFIEAAGAENVNGMTYITFGGLPPARLEGQGREFYDRYKARFGQEPEAYATYAYEAGKVVIAALKQAKTPTRTDVLAALQSMKDFEGILGKWSFDENGDTSLTTMSGNVIKDGKFEFSEILSAE